MSPSLLDIRDLKVHFPVRKGGFFFGKDMPLKAVDGVGFSLAPGETLGVVGESGCGKSTLGRAILQLIRPTAGSVSWMGDELTVLSDDAMRRKRAQIQIIFQDPLASLDPRMPIGEIIAEPLKATRSGLGKADIRKKVETIMQEVGLLPQMINRYPHEFSGGQCQRIGIARAMIVEPKLIICDEPVSALDVSIQAQIINLLMELQARHQVSLVFISHDLSVVRHISHRIMVLYLGQMMELSDRDRICESPRHPYTQALISAVPVPDPKIERAKQRIMLTGDLPSPLDPPSGCVFRTRCPIATDRCAQEVPASQELSEGHTARCHYAKID